MQRAAVAAGIAPALQPGERPRLLAELETLAGSLAEMAYARGWCEGRHSHRKASLIYIVVGDHWATHSLGGDTCRARTVRYLPAGEPHETYFPLGSTCLQIELPPSILRLAAEQGPALKLPGEVRDPRAAGLGARLHREMFTRDDLSHLAVEALTLQLLLCAERGEPSPRRATPPWVLKVGEMLREELHRRFALQEIARAVGRHPVQVSRQFHHHFGCTMSEYVRRARVARAQWLLRYRDYEISEVALACGFADQSHFTTSFRRLAGMPPHRYRLAFRQSD
jgi:AraC family transcriptional regulator